MANPKQYSYTVTGWGEFPYDMLRYDACWPKRAEDAGRIPPITGDAPRSITLQSYHRPTVDRWRSFLWTVGPVETH